MKKYIYLDWNVVKYLRENRNGQEFHDAELNALIFRLRNRYIFPFSLYHVHDRIANYNPVYEKNVSDDLTFFEKLADQNCIGWNDFKKDIEIAKVPISVCRAEVENEKKKKLPVYPITKMIKEYKVDMSKLDKSHPMYEFLESHQAKMNPLLMQEFLDSFYNSIFDDGNLYKKFRNYVSSHKEEILNPPIENHSNLLSFLHCYFAPYIQSFDYDFDQLLKNWGNIANSWFSFTYGSDIPHGVLLSHGYMLLEGHPLFHDKISKNKNNLSNINRDSNHLFFASQAEYLISEDKHFRDKAKFIYKVYDIKTKVVSETEFLEKFC